MTTSAKTNYQLFEIMAVTTRRANTIVVPVGEEEEGNLSHLALTALQSNAMSFGYMLAPEVLRAVSSLSLEQAELWANNLTRTLRDVAGVRNNQHGFYRDFPEEVVKASDETLVVNAMLHYFGDLVGLRITPPQNRVIEASKPMSESEAKYSVLGLATESDLVDYAVRIMSSPSSISMDDVQDFKALSSGAENEVLSAIVRTHASEPLNRENKTHLLVCVRGLEDSVDVSVADVFPALVDTATDVLRYAIGRSGGDVSLAQNHAVRLRTFPRAERRMMLSSLNRVLGMGDAEDLTRHESAFKRLARALHPGDYRDQFPYAAEHFRNLAEGRTSQSFSAIYDAWVKVLDEDPDAFSELLDFLVERPGEFARRLNHVLSLATSGEQRKAVTEAFAVVSPRVPSTVLWQARTGLEGRNEDEKRVVLPKGAVSKTRVIDMPAKAYGNKALGRALDAVTTGLLAQYGELSPLGKVYVDPELDRFTIPSGLRSASKASNAIGRGTRIPFADAPIQRFFIWWKDMEGADAWGNRVDVDLSTTFLDHDFRYRGHVSYTNLRTGGSNPSVVHSGDFTSAPNGAAEYIDVDVEKLLSEGVSYVAMNIYSFTHQKFSQFECFGGVMGRKDQHRGDTFDPRTTERIFEVSADSTHAVPMILDLVNREMVWGDVVGNIQDGRLVNVESSLSSGEMIAYGIANKRHATYAELLTLHGIARGELVDSPEEADTVFAVEGGIPSVTLDTVLSEYL